MQDWSQLNLTDVLHHQDKILTYLNTPQPDSQQQYYHALCFLQLIEVSDLKDQINNVYSDHYHFQSLQEPQMEQLLANIINIMNSLHNREQINTLISKIQPIEHYLQMYHAPVYLQTILLNNKIIPEYHCDYIVHTIESIYSLTQHKSEISLQLIQLIGQTTIKPTLKTIFKQCIQIQSLTEFIIECYQYHFLNSQNATIIIKQTSFDIVLLSIKRLWKWNKHAQFIIIEQLNDLINSNHTEDSKRMRVIGLIASSLGSTYLINKIKVINCIKSLMRSQDQLFYVSRILKYLRHNNHRDADCAYRVGVYELDEANGELFRVAIQLESDLFKVISESNLKIQLIREFNKNFKREPYVVSLEFIIQLLQMDFQIDNLFIMDYWKVVKSIFTHFFIKLHNLKITNLFDYEGVFVDEFGKSKLVTKVGNMKRNAKKLIPLFSQLIINASSQSIPFCAKQLFKMIFADGLLQFFYNNFIYQPMCQKELIPLINSYSISKSKQCFQLHQLLPLLLRALSQLQTECRTYLLEYNDQINHYLHKRHLDPIRAIEKLGNSVGSSSLIRKVNQHLWMRLTKGDKLVIALNKDIVNDILQNNIQILKGQPNQSYLTCIELIAMSNLLKLNIEFDCIYDISTPSSQQLMRSLIRVMPHLFDRKTKQNYSTILVDNLQQLLINCGYYRQEMVQQLQQIDETEQYDENGDIYYQFSTQPQIPHQQEVYSRTRNQHQLIAYLTLLNEIIKQDDTNPYRYEFNVEQCSTLLQQTLKLYSAQDNYIVHLSQLAIDIIINLQRQSSEITILKQIDKAAIKFNSQLPTTITPSFIVDLLLLRHYSKQLDIPKLILILDLVSNVNNSEQQTQLLQVLFEITHCQYKLQNQPLIEYFTLILTQRNVLTERLLVMEQFCDYMLETDNTSELFKLFLQIYASQQSHLIINSLINFSCNNLHTLGFEYLIIPFVGLNHKLSKVQHVANQYKRQFKQYLYYQEKDTFKCCNLLNILLYISQNVLDSNMLNQIFRIFFKMFMPKKNKQHYKRQILIVHQFQYLLNEIQWFKPKQLDFDIFRSNKLDVDSFEQIVQCCSNVFVQVCGVGRKFIQDGLKQAQVSVNCIDDRYFDFNVNTKAKKLACNSPQLISPVVFYSDNRQSQRERIMRQ